MASGMCEPRIFHGWPLKEVSLAFLAQHYEDERIKQENAAEVAPGIFVQVMAHGDFIMPDGEVTSGARIAVWDERLFVEQLRRVVEELYGLADHYHEERGKLNSCEDDEGALRQVQARAAYLSGLEFAFGEAGHKLGKLLHQQEMSAEDTAPPERQDLSWIPRFGPREENDATS